MKRVVGRWAGEVVGSQRAVSSLLALHKAGSSPSAFPGKDWGHTDEVQSPSLDLSSVGEGKSVGSGAPAGVQVPLSPPPSPMGEPSEALGTLGDPMARTWRVWVKQDCTGWLLSRRGSEAHPLCFKLLFPCDSLGTPEQCWMGSSSICFGLNQHKGGHENTVLNLQPF